MGYLRCKTMALPCVIGGLLVLLIRQDTKGVSLDEMAEIYAAKKPVA